MSSRRPKAPPPPSGPPPPPPPPRRGGRFDPGSGVAQAVAQPGSGAFPPVPWDWSDVVLALLTAVVLILIASNIAYALLSAVDPGSVKGFTSGHVTATASLALQTAVYAGAVAAIAVWVFGRRHARWADLGWRLPDRMWWIAVTPLVVLVVLIASNLLVALMTHIFPGAPNSQCVDVRGEFGHALGLAIPAVSIVAPVAEETIFRGFLYGWLRRRLSVAPAASIDAAIFAAAHGVPILLIPLFAVGLILALLYERSRSLVPGMIVHGLFNLVGIIAILGASGCT